MMDADGTPGDGHPTRLCPSPKQNLLSGRQTPESRLRGGPGRTRNRSPLPCCLDAASSLPQWADADLGLPSAAARSHLA